VHIPLLIKQPHQRKGLVDDEPVSLVDLFPTILGAAGVAIPPSDGVRIQEKRSAPILMEEHAQKEIHPLVSPVMKIADHVYGTAGQGELGEVWDGGSLCFRGSGGHWEQASCPGDWKTELDSLRALLDNSTGEDTSPERKTLSEQEKEQLRSLGYLK
jgi:hypothetical protein